MIQTMQDSVAAFRRTISAATVGELSFPTSLDASRRVLKAVKNPDIGLSALAKIVVAEPLLSAKVIRLANSVALNPSNMVVRDVRQAVVARRHRPDQGAGDGADHGSAAPFAAPRGDARAVESPVGAQRSCGRAVLCPDQEADAAERRRGDVRRDRARPGRFYLLSRAAEFPALLEDSVVLAETINDLTERTTERILGELNLPPSVVDAVLASRKFSGTMPPTTMGDILFIAGAVSPRPDPFDELDARVIPLANSAVALGLDQTMVSEIIAASGDEILLDRDRAGRLTSAERCQPFWTHPTYWRSSVLRRPAAPPS